MRIQIATALALITTACGCYFQLPAVERPSKFAGQIGDASSAAPLRVGVSTLPEMIQRFGPPLACYFDPNVCFWTDRTTRSVAIYILGRCNSSPVDCGPWDHRDHCLIVRLDANHRLAAFRIVSDRDDSTSLAPLDQARRFAADTAPHPTSPP